MPLGPPSLTYSSTCKALMSHVGDEVVLQVDRDYKAGALRVLAVCANFAYFHVDDLFVMWAGQYVLCEGLSSPSSHVV